MSLKESELIKKYLNGFELKNSKSYLYFQNLFNVKNLHALILTLIRIYVEIKFDQKKLPNTIFKRIHKRNMKCCFKLIDSIWDDFLIFLNDNIVFECKNSFLFGKEENIKTIEKNQN